MPIGFVVHIQSLLSFDVSEQGSQPSLSTLGVLADKLVKRRSVLYSKTNTL